MSEVLICLEKPPSGGNPGEPTTFAEDIYLSADQAYNVPAY